MTLSIAYPKRFDIINFPANIFPVSSKEVINSSHAPKAIGPYSQAVKVNNMVFLSGQIPLDPKTGQVHGSSIQEQTERVLKNIEAILKDIGGSLDNVVKTTVFMQNLSEFTQMNEVYSKFFNKNYPARATVEVAKLPKEVKVEIDAIAVL